jgi:hypothetical protein
MELSKQRYRIIQSEYWLGGVGASISTKSRLVLDHTQPVAIGIASQHLQTSENNNWLIRVPSGSDHPSIQEESRFLSMSCKKLMLQNLREVGNPS